MPNVDPLAMARDIRDTHGQCGCKYCWLAQTVIDHDARIKELEVDGHSREYPRAEAVANAALIADAPYLPRMLEALEKRSLTHDRDCVMVRIGGDVCSCGVVEAETLIAEIQKGPK